MAGRRVGLAAALGAAAARAAQLPSGSPEGCDRADWWAKVHDRVFFPPPASALELTSDISNYYYAVGSPEALTEEIKARRVGGEGKYHIFHLPDGPSTLQLPRLADRRASFSALFQLEQGTVLGDFPPYDLDTGYTQPLSAKGQDLERKSVAKATPEAFKSLLAEITKIGVGGVSTRSWANASASNAAVEFLQNKFLQYGLSSCLDKFETRGKAQANVIAMIPGSSPQSLAMVAHYDSRPFEGAAPGAVDNGSGLATLLLNARLAAEAGARPVRRLLFAAVAAEEIGLEGSKNLVSRLQSGYDVGKVLGSGGKAQKFGDCFPSTEGFLARRQERKGFHHAIVLDEVGYASPKRSAHWVNYETYDNEDTKAMMDHLAQANKDHNGAEMKVEHSSRPFGSDHMSFLEKGETALLVINSDDEGYPFYHKSGDVLENVDMAYAAKVVRMTHGGMLRIAGLQDDGAAAQLPAKAPLGQLATSAERQPLAAARSPGRTAEVHTAAAA